MFEKEAEEFADCKKSFWKQGRTCIESVIQAFQKGAEFGYKKGQSDQLVHKQYQLNQLRKANEWHYVKDGIFPTHSYRVLVYTDEGIGFGIYGQDNKKWYTYDTGFDVIAWKEIVLPELKENE